MCSSDLLTKISEVTLCKIFREIRILMSKECEKISKFSVEIEIDESHFGFKRVRGKRGRDTATTFPIRSTSSDGRSTPSRSAPTIRPTTAIRSWTNCYI